VEIKNQDKQQNKNKRQTFQDAEQQQDRSVVTFARSSAGSLAGVGSTLGHPNDGRSRFTIEKMMMIERR